MKAHSLVLTPAHPATRWLNQGGAVRKASKVSEVTPFQYPLLEVEVESWAVTPP